MQQSLHELKTLICATPEEWADWLAEHYTEQEGIWLCFAKKNSGIPSPTYQQALDEALCYGWIDAQKRSYDETYWLQRFLPRRLKSGWSKVNIGHIERLTAAGKMQPSGIKEVELAKRDGRWSAAYDSSRTATVPEDFQVALDANPEAWAFFETLNRQNRYAFLYRIQTTKKAETRVKKIQRFVEMLARGEKIHL